MLICGIYGILGLLVLSRSASTSEEAYQIETPPPTNAPVPTPTTPPLTLEPNWSLHPHQADGFSIALPKTWAEADLTAKTAAAALAPIKKTYPDFTLSEWEKAGLEEIRARGHKLVAFDMGLAKTKYRQAAEVAMTCNSASKTYSLDEAIPLILKNSQDSSTQIKHQRAHLPKTVAPRHID